MNVYINLIIDETRVQIEPSYPFSVGVMETGARND